MNKNSDFWQRGSSGILYLILGVIIIGAFLLVGGTTQLPLSQPDVSKTVELVAETPGASRNNLQLQTLKFKACLSTVTIDLLLDRSGSMTYNTISRKSKISRLKEAVLNLTGNLTDSSIIGIQSFSSDGNSNVLNITDDIPISLYKDVKSKIPTAVNRLKADGGTPTYDALKFSLDKLKMAVKKYPDKKFNFILISDGKPEPSTEDPRLPQNAPNPADEIKNLGVNIYTIGIYTKDQAKDLTLVELLKSIASDPKNYYEAPTGDEVSTLLGSISQKICDTDVTPTP